MRLPRFVLAVFLAGSTFALAADRPPQDLHLVDGHWTAWNPPAPPPGEQVHVIATGDTLWDLAARYYGNAYLWPQLWERNQYILDAHWIYPGDPLVLGIQVAPVDTLSQGPGGPGGGPGDPGSDPGAAPPEGALSADAATGAPIPLGAESDIYCQGYIGELEEQFPFEIIGSEAEAQSLIPGSVAAVGEGRLLETYGSQTTVKFGMATGDIVYVDGGRARGLSAGASFTVVAPNEPVLHPVRREVVGRYYRYLGRLRILSVQESTAIAEIVHSCDPIMVGSLLEPFEPEPVPLGRVSALRPLNFPESEEQLRDAPIIL
ncbi:MAG TPA: LysM domain-containing protein, partial [Thermoanaerobaculia bacterium]|nr:LysM domain-containing protein [Thermoanaerobaculia bacterium]